MASDIVHTKSRSLKYVWLILLHGNPKMEAQEYTRRYKSQFPRGFPDSSLLQIIIGFKFTINFSSCRVSLMMGLALLSTTVLVLKSSIDSAREVIRLDSESACVAVCVQ